MPDPGLMRHRVSVVRLDTIDRPDGGQAVVEVTVLDQVPTEFAPLTARERLQSGTIYAESTHRARCHWQPGVGPAMTAAIVDLYTGETRTFQIAAATNVAEAGWELELILTERVT
jgi:head-tail adaptor